MLLYAPPHRTPFQHCNNVAQILGTGVNSSGSLAPVSAPVASAQKDAMYRAFSQTDRKPQDVDFLELHATGLSHFQSAITKCLIESILIFSQELPPEIPRRRTGSARSSSAMMSSHSVASRATSGASMNPFDLTLVGVGVGG